MVSSFERVYSQGDTDYHVLFEGKSQTSKTRADSWHLTIRRSPGDPLVKYIFHKDISGWVKSIGINSLPEHIERVLLPWAAEALSRAQL